MQNPIFRKVALERLSTPEQLDQLMQVTTPRGWIGLAGLGGLLLVAIIWSFTARLPTEVAGSGILLHGGRVYQVVAGLDGQVTNLAIHPGDQVTPGQVVAQILPTGGASARISSAVTSPFGGRVIEVAVDQGSLAAAGATVALLEDSAAPLEAVVYMPADSAGKLRPGMPAQVALAGSDRQAATAIRGQVQAVGSFPASLESVQRTVGNASLAQQFLAGGPVVEVDLLLDQPAATAAGTPGGSLCTASVKIGEQRPIGLVLPVLDR